MFMDKSFFLMNKAYFEKQPPRIMESEVIASLKELENKKYPCEGVDYK